VELLEGIWSYRTITVIGYSFKDELQHSLYLMNIHLIIFFITNL